MTDAHSYQMAAQGGSSSRLSRVHRSFSLPTFGKGAWRGLLRHDTLKLIDGAGPDIGSQDQNKAEPASVNEKEPERQTALEKEQQNTTKMMETVKEQEHTSKTANCTFSGVVPIDLKRFTDSGISLVQCPDCGRMRSLSPVKGVLRFKPHTRRKQHAPLTGKRWSATGTTDWGVVGG